jgi:hypothetical protein
MAWLAIAAAAGSRVLGGFSEKKANESAENVARMNAFAARVSTALKVQDIEEAGERLRASQKVAAAASGVDISSGSVGEVMAASARQIEREIHRVKYTGALQEKGAMTQADAYSKAAGYALGGGILGGFATGISMSGRLNDIKVKGDIE